MAEKRNSNVSSLAEHEAKEWCTEKQIRLPIGTLTLKALTRRDEMDQVVGLQKEIWGYGRRGKDFPYPARCLFEFAESGGLIVGSFLNGNIIAFSAAWIGRTQEEAKNYLHSQLTGVLKRYRSSGVGFLVKGYRGISQNIKTWI